MAIAKLSGVALRYEDQGDGSPVVLIPGFSSGAWSWESQTDELSKYFRVITFDPRGVADSQIEERAPVSVGLIADDLAELLDRLSVPAAHILGISFGGFVAQEFALKYPKKVRKLVLVSTSFGGPNHEPPSMEVMAAFASTDGLNSPERIRKYLTTAFLPSFVDERPETVERFCELREANVVPETVYRQQLASAFAFDAEDRLSSVTAETLVVTGRLDSVVPMANSENIARRIPNARLEVIEDAGHMMFVEKAAEFNALVQSFLIRQ